MAQVLRLVQSCKAVTHVSLSAFFGLFGCESVQKHRIFLLRNVEKNNFSYQQKEFICCVVLLPEIFL